MSPALKRALRTLVQAILGAISAGALDQLGVVPANWVPVAAVVLTAVFSQVQNELEDKEVIPSVLKN